MRKIRIYWPVILVFFAFACKTRKKFKAPAEVVKTADSMKSERNVTAESLLEGTLRDWTYFSSKANVEYINGSDNQNVGANIRMYRDSLIWISVNVFGIEGARMLVNNDSVVVYDKLNKNYRVYRKDVVESVLGAPLSVREIQNIILAQPVYSLKLYNIIRNDESAFRIRNDQPAVYVSHSYKKQFYTIDTTLIEDRTSPHYASIRYDNYISVHSHNFPLNNSIYANNGSTLIKINMVFENPDFETAVNFPFTIPSTYERIK